MNLLIDIGNSRLKWAMHGPDGLADVGDAALPSVSDFACLDRLRAAPVHVVAANVAGQPAADALAAYTGQRWGLRPTFAETESSRGQVRNGYTDFRRLGVDRWLALLAAWQRCVAPVCVVDAGTALTVDLLAGDARHLGGFIIPGRELMIESLHRGTGDLERLSQLSASEPPAPPDLQPGRETGTAMVNGGLLAMAGLIERARAHLAGQSGAARLLVTGGDAPRLMRALSADAEHCPQLVLEGLALWAEETV